MANASLERAIAAIAAAVGNGSADVVTVAAALGKSPATLYEWRKDGHVKGAKDAVALQELAQRYGCEVTIRGLAGLENRPDDDGAGARPDEERGSDAQRARSATPTSPDGATPAEARARRQDLARATPRRRHRRRVVKRAKAKVAVPRTRSRRASRGWRRS